MLNLTIKGLWAHKLRYALTGLAVVLGVAFMAGTMVLTDTMQKTFDDVFESANAGTDVIVRQAAAIDGELAARPRVDAAVVEQVAEVDGVDAAVGSISGFAQLVGADGEASTTDGLGATFGANWIGDERLNPFTLDTGSAPAAADEAILDKRTAEEQGWVVGDRFSVLTKAGPRALTLVGTATYGDVDGLPGSTLVATDDETAQALFAEPDRFDQVLVAAAAGVSPSALRDQIDAELGTAGSGLESLTGSDDTAEKQADPKEDLSFFNQFLCRSPTSPSSSACSSSTTPSPSSSHSGRGTWRCSGPSGRAVARSSARSSSSRSGSASSPPRSASSPASASRSPCEGSSTSSGSTSRAGRWWSPERPWPPRSSSA